MVEPVGGWPGGLSARGIGRRLGLTAQQVNVALKEAGFLSGEPGAYGLTDRGAQFGKEHYHSNGVGGYSRYQVNYETRSWDESVIEELQKSMRQAGQTRGAPPVSTYVGDLLGDASGPPAVAPRLSDGAIVAIIVATAVILTVGVLAILYWFGPTKVRLRMRKAKDRLWAVLTRRRRRTGPDSQGAIEAK